MFHNFTLLLRHLIACILTLTFFLCSPLLLPLILIIWLPRFIIRHLAPLCRPDLGKLVTVSGSLFAGECDQMYLKRSRCGFYIFAVGDGTVTPDQVAQTLDAGFKKKYPNSDQFINPELMQILTSWWGYPFWRWDSNFNIQNHVHPYYPTKKSADSHDGNKLTICYDDEMVSIFNQLNSGPFTPNQSPWSVWVWNDVIWRVRREEEENDGIFGKILQKNENPSTVVMFRFHHSLVDGYSLLKLMLEDVLGNQFVTPIQPPTSQDLKFSLYKSIGLFLKAPFDLANIITKSWDFNEWHLPEKKLTFKLHAAISRPIPLETVKEIKKMFGVGFNVVLTAGFSGGIRNFMLERGIKIPNCMHAILPLPIKAHPTKLRNHWTGISVPLPIAIEDPIERIRFVERSFKNLKKSSVPVTIVYLLRLIGALPLSLIRRIPINATTTLLMTNFPGPTGQLFGLGHPIRTVMCGAQLFNGNTGVGAYSISYNGTICLGMAVDEAILGDLVLVQRLVQKVEEELQVLRSMEIV